MLSHNYTIVTAFFDINRGEWNAYNRGADTYFENAKNLLSVPDNMVIFIDEKYRQRVESIRPSGSNTLIISMKIEDLWWYKYTPIIEKIMNSEQFKNGLINPMCPEVSKPLYDVLMYNKTKFLRQVIEQNPFKSDRFVWCDFGIHQHMFYPYMAGKPLLKYGVGDKLRFLCRDLPQKSDLEITTFFKQNANRFAGTMFTGDSQHLLELDEFMTRDILSAFSQNVVDCDQNFFSNIFLQHQDMFSLYFGDWNQLLLHYYQPDFNVFNTSTILNRLDYLLPLPRINCIDNSSESILSALGYPNPPVKNKGLYTYSTKKLIRVKLMCDWISNIQLCQLWEKMNSDTFNIVTTADNDCDYFVIINRPQQGEYFDPKRTIIFVMEPFVRPELRNWYNPSDFLYVADLTHEMNNNEWHLSLTCDQLREYTFQKRDDNKPVLSAICSGLNISNGHDFRIKLIQQLQRENFPIDVYGKNSTHLFSPHMGELPYHQKDDGLMSYKYHIAVENTDLDNYYTEKLIDGILSECLCFYWGCKNVDKFLDSRAFILLPYDINESVKIIRESIQNDEYSKRLKYIKEMKNKILNELQFFPRISKFMK